MCNFPFKIAVCVYIYHTDIWPEFKILFSKLPKNCHIFLGLCEDNDNSLLIKDIELDKIKIQQISYHKNYGADIAPFLLQLKTVDFSNYKYIVKLHGKKSLFGRKMHVNWRSVILNSIIGDKDTFIKNINKINNNPRIGMMGTEGFIGFYESVNGSKIKQICDILNLNYDTLKNSNFVAGSMFIVRSSIYKKYFTKDIIDTIISLIKNNNEYGKLSDRSRCDGTFSHSIERIFGYLITAENKTIQNLKLSKIIHINDLSLVICYNNDCYIAEDVNCFGKVFNISNDESLIEWKHIENKNSVFQLYTKYKKGNKQYYVRS